MTAEQIHDALTLLPADLVAEADKKRTQKPKVIPWRRYLAMAACFALVLCSSWFCMRLFSPKGTAESVKMAPAEAAAPMQQVPADVSGAGIPEMAETEAAALEVGEVPETDMTAEKNNDLCELPAAPAAEEAAPEEEVRADTTSENSSASTRTLYAGMSQPVYVSTPMYLGGTACFTGDPVITLAKSRAELEGFRDKTPKQFELEAVMTACEHYDDVWFESHDLLILSLPVGKTSEVTAVSCVEGQWQICIENSPEADETEWEDQHILIGTEKGLIGNKDNVILISNE